MPTLTYTAFAIFTLSSSIFWRLGSPQGCVSLLRGRGQYLGSLPLIGISRARDAVPHGTPAKTMTTVPEFNKSRMILTLSSSVRSRDVMACIGLNLFLLQSTAIVSNRHLAICAEKLPEPAHNSIITGLPLCRRAEGLPLSSYCCPAIATCGSKLVGRTAEIVSSTSAKFKIVAFSKLIEEPTSSCLGSILSNSFVATL